MILIYLTGALGFLVFFFFFSRLRNLEFLITGIFLSLYHFLIGYINTYSAKGRVIDTVNYYNWGTTSSINYFEFSVGSSFIVHLVSWLDYFLPTFEIMSSFFCGLTLIVFLKMLELIYRGRINKKINNKNYFLLLIFLFLPGFHYWTVSLGKDSLMLFSIFFAILGLYNKNFLLFFVSCLIMLFVRVHIFALFFISLFLCEFFFTRFNFFKLKKVVYKGILLGISFPFAIGMFIFLFNYIQRYSSEGFSNIDEFLDSRAEVYADLGSGAWLSVQPYPIKVFAFLFGGVPWLSFDTLTLFSMLEGLIVFFIGLSIFSTFKKNFKTYDIDYKAIMIFLTTFFFILVFFFSLTNNNLGVMVRMKVMLYSPLIFLGLIAFSKLNTTRG